ncbi:MAG: MFS transporter [Alphaproteobacteria bacterium]|nr:MFS transporter [Alphaproteobacteria bacterium]
MYSAIASAWALLLGIALIMLGNGLQGTLLGVRATLEGFHTTVTGFVMTGYFAGFLVGSVLAPKIVERVGHIRVFAALASLASASALAHAVFVDPWSWGAMRLVTGFSYAGLYVVAESWLNDRATNETRGQILSIYMVIAYGGMTLGQLLLNVANPAGFALFALISVLVSLALVPISLTAVSAPPFDAPARVGLRQLYRISPLGVLGGLGTGMANGMVFGMGAVYARAAGMSVGETSLFMGLILLGGLLLQWPVGRVSDVLDRRKVIVAVTVLATALGLLLALVPGISTHGKLGLVFLLGGTVLPMYSLCGAHMNDHLDASQMVAANSGYVLINGLGASLGPVTVSMAMAAAGPGGFFMALAAVLGAIALFAAWRMTRRASVATEDRGLFVAMPPRTSPFAGALSPEAPEDATDWEDIPPDAEDLAEIKN